MNKTLNINLGGLIFHIDEDAFKKLEAYLGTLRNQFHKTNGGDEIINDVEHRMAELFKERTSPSKEVINRLDVDEVIAIMGKPEDYLQEEMEANYNSYESYSSSKKMHRDVDNRIIGGVASGLSAYFNINPIYLRVLFLVMLVTGGFGFILYLILWAVMPAARTTAEKLQMRGKPVTLSNIEDFVKEEGSAVGRTMSEIGGRARHYGGRGSNALGSFFAAIFQLIRMIFKFIFKIIGFFFLGIALIVIGSLMLSFFVGVEIDGVHFGQIEFEQAMAVLSLDSSIYNSIMIGLSLIAVGPLLLLIYYGLRIIFGIEPLNSSARKGLVLVTLAGIVMLIVSGIQVAQEFDDSGYQTTEQIVPAKNGMIILDLKKDSILNEYGYYNNENPWRIFNGKSYFTNVELDIKRSSSNRSYLITKTSAQGRTRNQARFNSRSLNHYLVIDTGLVMSSPYFTLAEKAPYRAQNIRMTLYLMVGDTVYLSDGMESIIYDIDNVQNYWDPDMVGHFWTMTDRGLFCTDCAESEMIKDRWDNEIEESEIQDSELEEEVEIRDGFIEIEEKQVHLERKSRPKMAIMLAPPQESFLI